VIEIIKNEAPIRENRSFVRRVNLSLLQFLLFIDEVICNCWFRYISFIVIAIGFVDNCLYVIRLNLFFLLSSGEQLSAGLFYILFQLFFFYFRQIIVSFQYAVEPVAKKLRIVFMLDSLCHCWLVHKKSWQILVGTKWGSMRSLYKLGRTFIDIMNYQASLSLYRSSENTLQTYM
jgi:hypothetical protein